MNAHKKIILGGNDGPIATANFVNTPLIPSWISFSRAGGAMFTDSTGKLTWAPENLLTYSVWSGGTAGVIGAGAVVPTNWNFGTTTGSISYPVASRGGSAIRTSGTLQRPFIQQTVTLTTGVLYLQSVYVDAVDAGLGTLRLVDVMTTALAGTTSQYYINGVAALSTDLIAPGQLISAVHTVGAGGGAFVRFGLGTAGNITGDVTLSSPQFERVTYRVAPSAYYPTTSAAYYGPRFDYDPSTLAALGLLLEGPDTNVALWNRDLTNAAWTATNITPLHDQTGIDGVANSASSITATAANGTILQAITLASSARFQSAYVKRLVGTGVINMTMDGGTTWTPITVTAGWTRVSILTQTLANPTVGFQIVTSGDSIAVDFVQNEGGTFASSPIWTTTAAVTRAADVAQIISAGLVPFQGNYGAVVIQMKVLAGDASNPRIISGASATNFGLLYDATAVVQFYNGTTSISSGIDALSYKRFAAAWDKLTPGRRVQGTGGSLVADGNTPNIGATTQWLGSVNGTSNLANMRVQSLALYNQNLTDAALAAKLTIDGPY